MSRHPEWSRKQFRKQVSTWRRAPMKRVQGQTSVVFILAIDVITMHVFSQTFQLLGGVLVPLELSQIDQLLQLFSFCSIFWSLHGFLLQGEQVDQWERKRAFSKGSRTFEFGSQCLLAWNVSSLNHPTYNLLSGTYWPELARMGLYGVRSTVGTN